MLTNLFSLCNLSTDVKQNTLSKVCSNNRNTFSDYSTFSNVGKYIHTQLTLQPRQSQYCTNSFTAYPYRRAGLFHCTCGPITYDVTQLPTHTHNTTQLNSILTILCILPDSPSTVHTNERLL